MQVFKAQSAAPAQITPALPSNVVAPVASFASLGSGSVVPPLANRIEQFYAINAPDKVSQASKLAAKHGENIWEALETKYPGKTAAFRMVS